MAGLSQDVLDYFNNTKFTPEQLQDYQTNIDRGYGDYEPGQNINYNGYKGRWNNQGTLQEIYQLLGNDNNRTLAFDPTTGQQTGDFTGKGFSTAEILGVLALPLAGAALFGEGLGSMFGAAGAGEASGGLAGLGTEGLSADAFASLAAGGADVGTLEGLYGGFQSLGGGELLGALGSDVGALSSGIGEFLGTDALATAIPSGEAIGTALPGIGELAAPVVGDVSAPLSSFATEGLSGGGGLSSSALSQASNFTGQGLSQGSSGLGLSRTAAGLGLSAPSTGTFAGLTPAASSAGSLSSLFSSGIKALQPYSSAVRLGSGLYDAYARTQAANALENRYNEQQQATQNFYAPGSPEAKLLEQQIARQDARAGRNSQYGARAVELAARLATLRSQNAQAMAPSQNALLQNQLTNRYGALNSLAALFGKETAAKALNPYLGDIFYGI